jgi:hypothetical protein
MPHPILLGLAKGYLADKVMDAVKAPSGVREAVSFAADPKGYLVGKGIEYASRRGSDSAPSGPNYDAETLDMLDGMSKGGKVKSKSASSRGDGCCKRGKTRGKMY